MDIANIVQAMRNDAGASIDAFERQPGCFQVVFPVAHEDGDMVDVYLVQSPEHSGRVRVCDFGMTLMRLSYDFEVDSAKRQRIFNSILINSSVRDDDGNLYMDSSVEELYPNILQFAGCAQKVMSMRFWSQDSARSSFYEDLKTHTQSGLARFQPRPDVSPLPDYSIITVDWSLQYNARNLYLFGIKGNEKAKSTAISLLEFQKAQLRFISVIVHEDMGQLGKKEQVYLTKNADKQYPSLEDFTEQASRDIERMVA